MVLQVDTAQQYDPTFIVPNFHNIHINPCRNLQNVHFSEKIKPTNGRSNSQAIYFFPKDLLRKDLGWVTPL
ncbi:MULTISPECIES: hypothetical protein [unclassified Microcoleus]|uniref:hypothetical protein n=1 Tax=unclassified Microcoleus TaxID=2642155 RepID=UPI002FD5D888